jgi:hypothetical protein
MRGEIGVAEAGILTSGSMSTKRWQLILAMVSFFFTSRQSVVACSGGIPSKVRGGAAPEDLNDASWHGGGAWAAAKWLGDSGTVLKLQGAVIGATFIRGNYHCEAQGLRDQIYLQMAL